MIAYGMAPHVVHVVGMLALLLAAIVVGPRAAGAGETSMGPRTPTTAECAAAQRQAYAVTRDEDAVSEALIEAIQRLRREGGDFTALVVATAKRRKLDAIKTTKAERERNKMIHDAASDALAASITQHKEPVAVEPEAEPAAPDLDSPEALAALRTATLTECRRRLVDVTGEDGVAWLAHVELGGSSLTPGRVEEERKAASAARDVLRGLAGAPEYVVAKVDHHALRQYAAGGRDTWRTLTAGRFRVLYLDAEGKERVYGLDHAEAAVLSLLCGSWPPSVTTVTTETTPAAVIRLEADAIRRAIERR